jgi:Mitochondrial carrier protein
MCRGVPADCPGCCTRDQSNLEYIIMSGSSKLVAIGVTYPYQVVRSRIQNQLHAAISTTPSNLPLHERPYSSIPDCIVRTYRYEGMRAFYKGLWPNAVRVLPGTWSVTHSLFSSDEEAFKEMIDDSMEYSVTFVVYENLSTWLRRLSERGGIDGVVSLPEY